MKKKPKQTSTDFAHNPPNPFDRRHQLSKRDIEPIILTKKFRTLIVGSVIVLAAAYILFQIGIASVNPSIEITSPEYGSVSELEFTFIEGSVDQDVNVTINDNPVIVNLDGQFRVRVILEPGANTFRVKAFNSIDRASEIEHVIVYEED